MTTKGVLVPEDIPAFVHKYPDIIKRIEATGVFQSSPHGAPNHFILNEYFPGQGIMPHEDGPAYYPVVATLSLGSHAMFHYYQYKPQAVSANGDNNTNSSENGRPIDPTPVLSVLLEPRSLIVTQSSLYTSHLHGIDDVVEDVFLQASNSENCSVRIANLDLLKGTEEREAIINGGVLKRGIRYSLTCRDVAKVASSIPLRKRY
ncbi:hypothetical protein AcV7_010302 [Taiwanofungus camphoratus]|nr:hypothetical protein AcV7_010302 [Antrodia cinnamomea]